jgi:error-prone DNA polymerase
MVRDDAWVRVAGLVVCPHRPPTRSGRRVLFVSLEDEFGLVDAVLFEPVYQAYGHWVLTHPVVIVEGRLQRRGRGLSVIVHRVEPYRPIQVANRFPEPVEQVCLRV